MSRLFKRRRHYRRVFKRKDDLIEVVQVQGTVSRFPRCRKHYRRFLKRKADLIEVVPLQVGLNKVSHVQEALASLV